DGGQHGHAHEQVVVAAVDDEHRYQGVEGEQGQPPGAGAPAGQEEQPQGGGQRRRDLEPQTRGQGGPGPEGGGGAGDGQEGGTVGRPGVLPLHRHAGDDRVPGVLGRGVAVGNLVVGDEDPAVGGVAPEVARPLGGQGH